ncbi:hypothetical protein ACFQ1E_07815 [Sphingomonas canadensis]|uniref:EF-hand domain-containing protein n=1 Tax=Sphingomonas canadensis TaxID=1219257 RepID=A0ABW3H9X6_9SPHN|nr:hypothetical protein [Sphingomonas canadensis]MCW3835942.1 hypothetical protein [Sphingomonas canadensis]
MYKALLLTAVAAVSVPALAQEAPPAGAPPQESAPAQPAADPAVPQEGQDQPTAAAPAQDQSAAQPATSADQVAAVVGKEFASYDKDASGALDKAEFSTWMAALRKASDPAFDAGTAEAKAWSEGAFAQADADKNAGISQVELTVFLTPKAG